METSSSAAPRVAVVGSGIAGITAALGLRRAGFAVEVLERDDRLGGRFGIDHLGDRPVMTGGKNIGRGYSQFRSVVAELGDHPWEPFGINSSRVIGGEIRTLDTSHLARSLRHTFEVASPVDLGRLGVMAARIRADRANAFLGSPYFSALGRRRDVAPLSAHFGAKLVQNMLRPMTIRMNGAEPDEVYLGTFGTNLSLMLDTYEQLTDGIQPVLREFESRIPVVTGATVRGLVVEAGRVRGVHVEISGETVERDYDGVVLATPAYAAAELLSESRPALAERLTQVRYFPSTVVLVEYDRPFFESRVRALVLDEGPCTNVGAYGADDRHIVRYTFSGRDGRLEPTPELLSAWVDQAEQDVAGYLHSAPGKRIRSISRHWPAAYCAYGPYYADLLTDVRRQLTDTPGLALCGDYLFGVNLEACSRSGAAAAAALTDYLERAVVPA